MKRFVAALPVLLSVVVSVIADASPIGTLPPREKRWALVIGVDRYEDPDISLKGGAKDAHTLRDALVEVAGFPAEQVLMLATGGPAEPTRNNMLAKLSNVLRRVPHDGIFVLAFSGHGIERGGEVYLFPSDVHNSDNLRLLQNTALSVGMIREEIETNEIAQVVFFIDACRNDPGGRSSSPNKVTQAFVDRFRFDAQSNVKAYAALFAASPNQRAYEYEEKRQGYFTWAVVEGLRGAAANERGEVTLQGLASYLEEVVPQRVALDLGNEQVPEKEIRGYRADTIVLAVGPEKAARVVAVPSVPPDAIELRFWESVEKLNTREAYEEYLRRYPNGIWAPLARIKTATVSSPAAPPTSSLTEAKQAMAAGEYARARSILEKSAAEGDFAAKAELGRLLYLCLGGPCDHPGARKLLDEAAKGGARDAEGWLAIMTIAWGGDIERAISYGRSDAGSLAHVVLGLAHEKGLGVALNEKEAYRLYTLALPYVQAIAERGDPWAYNFLAVSYRKGDIGFKKDPARAAELFRKAAERGLAGAMANLGELYVAGEGVQRDEERGRSLYRTASNLGHPSAMYYMGWAYEVGWGVAKDEAKAAELYSRAADLGHASAINSLAIMYESGRGGLPKDEVRAAELYRRAAEWADGTAMSNLGNMYRDGRGGLTKNPHRAVELYRRGTNYGDAAARNNLGYMYEYGLGGLPRDEAKAVELYRQSADEGSSNAQYNLATMYLHGRGGLAKDEKKVAELLRLAADQGHHYAQNELALMYEKGLGGLPKDIAKAVEWYRKSAEQGDEKAKTNLARLGY